jgi:hypothetical protein
MKITVIHTFDIFIYRKFIYRNHRITVCTLCNTQYNSNEQ